MLSKLLHNCLLFSDLSVVLQNVSIADLGIFVTIAFLLSFHDLFFAFQFVFQSLPYILQKSKKKSSSLYFKNTHLLKSLILICTS